MPPAQASPAPPDQADPARDLLTPLSGVDQTVKVLAHDVYWQSPDPETFKTKLTALALPQEVKARLWDARYPPGQAQPAGAPAPAAPGKTGPEGSAASRYFGNLYAGTLGLVPAVGGKIINNFSEQGFLGGLGETAMDVLGVRPMTAHLQQATQARRNGDWGLWLSNMIRAIPIAGPVGESLGTKLQEGDVAGAAGEVTADLVPFAAAKGAKYVKPTVMRAASKIPLTLAERGSKIPGAGYAQALAERTIPGSVVFKKFRERQQAALAQLGNAAAARISTLGGTASDVGAIVQQAIDLGRKTFKAHADEMYEAIDEKTKTQTVRNKTTVMEPGRILDPDTGRPVLVPRTVTTKTQTGGVMPSTLTLKKEAVTLLRRLKDQAQLMDPNVLSSYRQSLEHILKAPARLSFRAFQDTRSDLLRIVRSVGDPVPGKRAGLAARLAQITDAAMMTAAEASGIHDLPFMVRTANDMWKDLKTTYNSAFFKKLGKASPETISALLQKADLDDLTMLKDRISRTAWDAASARVLRDVLEGATEPPPSTGPVQAAQYTLTHGTTPPTAPVMSGSKLSHALRKLGGERADALFGARGHADLLEIADLAEKVNPAKAQSMIPGLLAGGINAAVLYPFLRLDASLIPAATSAAGTFYGLAKVLTTQPGRIAYRDLVRAVGQGNRPLALAAGARVMQQIAARAPGDQDAPDTAAGSPPTTPGPAGRVPASTGAGAVSPGRPGAPAR